MMITHDEDRNRYALKLLIKLEDNDETSGQEYSCDKKFTRGD